VESGVVEMGERYLSTCTEAGFAYIADTHSTLRRLYTTRGKQPEGQTDDTKYGLSQVTAAIGSSTYIIIWEAA
jgi:hypothetical protein